MNELRFSCPHCGQHFIGPEEYIGRDINCPACKTEFPLADPRLTTSLRLQSQLSVAAPGPDAHGAPIAPEVQARLDAAEAASQVQRSKTARLTQFLGHLLHPKASRKTD